MQDMTSSQKDRLLEEILQEWEKARMDGKEIPVESLCALHPALKDQIIEQVQCLKEMDWLSRPPSDKSPSCNPRPEAHKPRYRDLGLNGIGSVSQYKLIQPLGQGGFGEVWKAEGPGGMPVALKVVPLNLGLDSKEVRALELFKTIRHPHLLVFFGYWFYKGNLWIAMELADTNLYDLHQKSLEVGAAPIAQETVLRYFQEAAEAIDYLNVKKHHLESGNVSTVQHRDIKLQNLLIVGDSVKLGDFGLARPMENGTNLHSGSFTVSYAPPEYFEGKTCTTSDQYSLAVCYVRFRGGAFPYDGSVAQIMHGSCSGNPDLSHIPEAERPAILRALSPKPEDRWPTCVQFVNALKATTDRRRHE